MKKLLLATAAIATLGLTAAANAQTYYRTAPGPTVEYYEPAPGPGRTVIIEGRNSTMMSNEAQRYVPESYSPGSYLGPTPYANNPGVEPHIAKQIQQDQKGSN